MVKGAISFWLQRAAIIFTQRKPSSWLQCIKPLSSLIRAIPVVFPIVHARFIHINNDFIHLVSQLFYEGLPFRLIPIKVAVSLFFRLNSIFFNAREIVRELISPCHSCAIRTARFISMHRGIRPKLLKRL
jgi:hypothetical protein